MQSLEMPCGDNCFVVKNKRNNIQNVEIWTGSEKSLFLALQPIYKTKYCDMAVALMSKTCKEVYMYAENLKKNNSMTNQNILCSNNKKKSYSQILYHLNKVQKKADKKKNNQYTPCTHKGKCTKNNCNCSKSSNFCEKFCNCNINCNIRFPGCRCKGNCSNKTCLCFGAERECDPDLCKSCGCGKYDLSQTTCTNISIQRRLCKKVIVAPSKIHGWGCFSKNKIEKNEFILEYCGEFITQFQAEQRGQICDEIGCSYLFNLNNQYVIDAKEKGNQARFVNHSTNPNCYAKVMLVNGDHRIGIFAKQTIESGEELLFDYRYRLTQQLKYVFN